MIKYERIVPLEDKILIKPLNMVRKEGDTTGEQTLLRDIAQRKILNQPIEDFEITKAMNSCAIVCAVSEDCRWVSKEDVIFFGKYAGAELMIESEVHLMIRESDVLFILK